VRVQGRRLRHTHAPAAAHGQPRPPQARPAGVGRGL